jgi:hypothetical protein
MQDPRRDILAAVARGELSPEEGAARLEELPSPPPGPATAALPPLGEPASPGPAPTATLRAVRIVRSLGSAVIVGDPQVREAVAEGRHVAEREGDTLVIRSAVIDGPEGGDDTGGYFSYRRGGIRIRTGRHSRLSIGGAEMEPLRVRMNPRLALELESQAGSIRISGVEGPVKARVQAGSLTIEGFRGPLDVNVQAGSLRGSGILDQGLSRISCEAGSVRLQLERGSSVRVRTRSTLGKVSLGDSDTVSVGGGVEEMVIGSGQATLEIDSTMGSVRIEGDS